jgi:hypothetical protein
MLTTSNLDSDSPAITERAVAPMRTVAELDRLLDEALANTFPASDPVSQLRISSSTVEA